MTFLEQIQANNDPNSPDSDRSPQSLGQHGSAGCQRTDHQR